MSAVPLMGIPSQTQLLFPLMEVLEENGPMRARDACAAVADKLQLPSEVRNIVISRDGWHGPTNLLDRRVRWTRQTAVGGGLLSREMRGKWELSDKGKQALIFAKPGFALRIARDAQGDVVWADARTLMGHVDKGSVNAIVTSPPYPLSRQRDYDAGGEWAAKRYLDTLLSHVDAMEPLLRVDGSLVMNLSDCYLEGRAELNPYQEELSIEMLRRGWHLLGKEPWINPSKPRTTPWVTKHRIRQANAVEYFFWWSPTTRPKADNRRILVPYSDRQRKLIDAGGEVRRCISGSRQSHPGVRYAADNGGSIPYNYTVSGHEGPRSEYSRYCEEKGLPRHPAMMPRPVVEKYVKLLTEPDDLVADFFAGSLVVPSVCKQLGRRYLAGDACLQYLEGGLSRLGEGIEVLEAAPEASRVDDRVSA
jgi:site-specific DNA-methyltransferase (cytosine-N4-specific)